MNKLKLKNLKSNSQIFFSDFRLRFLANLKKKSQTDKIKFLEFFRFQFYWASGNFKKKIQRSKLKNCKTVKFNHKKSSLVREAGNISLSLTTILNVVP